LVFCGLGFFFFVVVFFFFVTLGFCFLVGFFSRFLKDWGELVCAGNEGKEEGELENLYLFKYLLT